MNITIAGAGAGKTTNLAGRIKKRYKETNDYGNIYCIAYTNNAVDNISRKLAEKFDGDIPDCIHVQTIHSFLFQEIIRPYYYLLFNNSFDVFSFRDKGSDARYYNKLFKELEERRILHVDAATQRAYWVMVKKSDDNADIKKRRKVIQASFSESCNSIFMDESQDIDESTYEILKLLDSLGVWIDLVGDPKQDLRGYGYLRKLMNEYPNNITYVSECFRCPEKILRISNTIIPESEKQHSEIDGGEIKVIFESGQDNIVGTVNSPIYDMKYINKKNGTFDTHNTEKKSLEESLTEVFERILPNYFADITSSELRIKRTAYCMAGWFVEDWLNGIPLNTSIYNIIGRKLDPSDYKRVACTLKFANRSKNVDRNIVVDSIERIKGREGRHCLFILTPDLAAYLLGDKIENNKTKSALYVGLTRSYEKLTVLVTIETEQKYGKKRFEDFFEC